MTEIEIHEDGGAAVLITTRFIVRVAQALLVAGYCPKCEHGALRSTLRIACEARDVHLIRDRAAQIVAELGAGS